MRMEGQNGKEWKKMNLIIALIWSIGIASLGEAANKPKTVQMRKDLPLKIAVFADLHFGEDAWTNWGPLQDVLSINLMSSILDQHNPDFVIYLGDVITANNIPIENASLYWDQALSPTKDRLIPWASVFGNHDDAHFVWPKVWFDDDSGIPPLNCSSVASSFSGENCSFKGTTRSQLMDRDIRSNNTLSFSEKGPEKLWPSVSNYVLKLSSSSEDSDSPVAFLYSLRVRASSIVASNSLRREYFLDSGGGTYPEVISAAQVKWFNTTSQELNPDSRVPEIIFWHIPSKAYKTVAPSGGEIDKPCVGSINKENVAPQEAEHGIMQALEARPSVQAVFVGHNHGLDWCCPYKKMWLCYARHSGYGGYGDWDKGARILEITEKPFSLKSWIAMENGEVHSHVSLTS